MAWKKMAAAHFLLETSPPAEITSQIAAAEVGAEEGLPQEPEAKTRKILHVTGEKNVQI